MCVEHSGNDPLQRSIRVDYLGHSRNAHASSLVVDFTYQNLGFNLSSLSFLELGLYRVAPEINIFLQVKKFCFVLPLSINSNCSIVTAVLE